MDNVFISGIDGSVIVRAALSPGQFSYLVGLMLAAIFAISWKAHL